MHRCTGLARQITRLSCLLMTEVSLDVIVNLCKRRGIVFPSSEIYGGLRSAWDWGPLGVELKRNVKNEWWRTMVHERDDVVGLESSILMSPRYGRPRVTRLRLP